MNAGDEIDDFFRDRRVMVTGACGTVGRALLTRLEQSPAQRVIGLDHAESAVFELGRRFDDARVSVRLGDVGQREPLIERFRGVDVVLHTAAYKHVTTCEASPRDAVSTNVGGTQNVIDAARQAGVGHVLFTSSDKAVNPTSVMGTSKLLSERLIVAAAAQSGDTGPVFACTRFGNVLGSSGSVVPVFARQIARGGPVTLTDPAMNRFVMTGHEAVELVLDSVRRSQGGEIFVTKMRALEIPDLARALIGELAPAFGHDPQTLAIETVGARPGEKLFEELVGPEESRRLIELAGFFVILPALSASDAARLADAYGLEGGSAGIGDYRSDTAPAMAPDAIRDYLRDSGLVETARAEGMACVS